ncbi:MAG: hypothetical protein AB7N65_14645 [Vicinamibacterales bacterium]
MSIKTSLRWLAAAIVVAAVVGGGYWAMACPCAGVPGFVLLGAERPDPVQDWSFANDVTLCQVQISTGLLPHSVNLNCMATPTGDLFLSCSAGTRKYWCQQVGPNHPGRLRLNGTVYPVVLNRVTDPATLDAAWAARVRKLQNPEVQAVQPPGATPAPDAKRPDTWWTFQVRSRAS